jgi:hypothetical protein
MRSKNSLCMMIFVSLMVLSACVGHLPKTVETAEPDSGSELDCVDCTGMDHYNEGDGIQVSLFTVHDESNPYRWHAQLTVHALEDRNRVSISLTSSSDAECSVVISGNQVALSAPRKYLNVLSWELDLEQGQTENYEIELNECSLVQSGRIAELEVEAMTSNGHFVFDRNTIFVEGDNYQVLLYRTPYPTSANDPFMHNSDSYDENVTPMYPSPTPPATPADAIQTVYFLMTGTPYPTTPPRTATPVPPTPTPGVYP